MIFCKYFIFLVIGVIPGALADYQVIHWEWWTACTPLWIGVWMRDYALRQ